MRFFITLLLALFAAAFATYGVDVSQRTYSSNFQCMVQNGYSFAIVRVYRSTGSPDPNGPYTINDAWSGGMSYVDGYIFPDYFKGNGAQQVKDTVNYLASNGLKHVSRPHDDSSPALTAEEVENFKSTYGMLWLDIEGTQYWSSSTSSNVAFIRDMYNECKALGVSCGMYTSKSQWDPITGGDTGFGDMPLWYAHYDNNPSFSDFSAFGGWSKPAIKQYAGDVTLCSAGVDKNYY
jgi:GH25 family lysozyme M1 (1,4-beta-N-acetylmuramidase)